MPSSAAPRPSPRADRAPTARHRWLAPAAAAIAAGASALAGCGDGPVLWDEAAERRLPPPPISAATGAPGLAADLLVTRTVGELVMRPPAGLPAGTQAVTRVDTFDLAPPPDPAGTRCPASLRVTVAPAAAAPGAAPPDAGHAGHAAHAAHGGTAPNVTPGAAAPAAAPAAPAPASPAAAVWWALRPDRSAALYLSRSADGGRTWGVPLPVDTVDRSEAGCERPAPALALDPRNGYLHVAYSMRAPEGQGVFYAHQMDPRGPFERPQVIVYGDRPAATSVASAGDRVVVAYEDPNTGGRPFVSLALSRTAGHSWAERVPVSESNVAAERPVVALRGADEVVLGWVERSAPRRLATTDDNPRAAVAALPSGVVVRVGRLRE